MVIKSYMRPLKHAKFCNKNLTVVTQPSENKSECLLKKAADTESLLSACLQNSGEAL